MSCFCCYQWVIDIATESQMTLRSSPTVKYRTFFLGTVVDTVALARARRNFIALAHGGRGVVKRTGLPAVKICRKHVINALLCRGKYTVFFLIF